jgi:septal ring factor EnvC (AmiA/AmiB activator)
VPADSVLQKYNNNIGSALHKLPPGELAEAAKEVNDQLRVIRSCGQDIGTAALTAEVSIKSAVTVLGDTADVLALSFSAVQANIRLGNNANVHAHNNIVQQIRSNLHTANSALDTARGDVNTLLAEIKRMYAEIDGGDVALRKMEKQLYAAGANANKNKSTLPPWTPSRPR